LRPDALTINLAEGRQLVLARMLMRLANQSVIAAERVGETEDLSRFFRVVLCELSAKTQAARNFSPVDDAWCL